jgi:hypothetical protein
VTRIFAVGLVLASLCSTAGAVGSNLQVTVQSDNGPLARAAVVALHFVNGNPDPASSRVGVTDASGNIFFNLVTGADYQVVASSQGFLPAIIDQLGNGTAPSIVAVAPSGTPPTVTITISSLNVSGVGEIDVLVGGASHNALIFGQVGLQAGGGASAYGVTVTNGSGASIMSFLNVANAPAGTYQVSAFDPTLNRAASLPVGTDLNLSTPTIDVHFFGLSSLDFASAPPPVANLSQSQQSGASGNLSVSGVVTDTSNAVAIPFIPINFGAFFTDQYGQTHNDWRGTSTDQNGTFQLYGLIPGVTYYSTTFGGCYNGQCYGGFQSSNSGVPGANDIFYASSATVVSKTIQLAAAPASTGTLAINITDQFGNFFPQASIGLYPDGTSWSTGGGASCGATQNHPGLKNVNLNNVPTGYALIDGLPSGNYMLNVWTPYGQTSFNAPKDQFLSGSCPGSNGPYYRLNIDTNTTPDVHIYDVYGNAVGTAVSSVTVQVVVSTSGTGSVQGTLSFPSPGVDLSQNPILISLNVQCNGSGNCPNSGGFTVLSSSNTPQSQPFAIAVSSGYRYFMNIKAAYWGAIFAGGNQPQPDLTVSTYAVVNLRMGPAGRVLGTMRKPDGSAYIPPQGQNAPNVNAEGNSSWGDTQVNPDGSFAVGGLLPGSYTLSPRNYGGGSFPYTAKQPAPAISVVANQDVHQDLLLDNAVTVRPVLNPALLPPFTQFNSCSQNGGGGDCPPESWTVLAYPAGTVFNSAFAASILAGGGSQTGQFQYSPSSGTTYGHCNGQFLSQPGFCAFPISASPSGSSYDFYSTRKGNFDSGNLANGSRPYFVIETSSRNVTIRPDLATGILFDPAGSFSGSTTAVQNVPMDPAVSLAGTSQAVLVGSVTISNLINQREFTELGGDFNKFLNYLPFVWVYDSSGALKAVGMVVPYPPSETVVDAQLNQAVTGGNFSAFQTLMYSAPPAGWGPVGFDIRGLTAGQSYNLVVTTPNYPPFKTSVTLGSAGSTTRVDINLDANPGASIAGVVQSTSATPISGAQVTVKADGYLPTTLTTDNAGAWSLTGLGAGHYQLLAAAAGYAQAAQTIDVTGTALINVPAFSLAAANASIAGTVYTNNPVCPAGASCSAFGKTVLQGITVYAYDDTLNVQNPTATLPLYKTVTDSSGTYRIDGLSTQLIPTTTNYHQFKVFVNAPDYYVLNQTTEVVPGGVVGFAFALKPKPLTVNVFGHPVGANYEFQVTNYKQFSSGKAYISVSPFLGTLAAGTTDVSAGFIQRPDAQGNQQLFLDYPLASLTAGIVYVLHVEAVPNDPRAPVVIKEINFGQDLGNGTCQSIDQALIGDDSSLNAQGLPANLVSLDISGGSGGNSSGLGLPAGGVIPITSTAVPTMCMTATDPSAPQSLASMRTSGVPASAFVSDVYKVTLSSLNYTNKGVDLTLSYNQNGSLLNDLALFTFDTVTQKWKPVPGVQTIDPVRGTVSIKGLTSLSTLGVAGTKTTARAGGKAAQSFMAVSNGRTYRPNGITLFPDDSGIFAILRPSQVSGGAYTGTVVKVYNFPNPFNLATKTVPTAGAGICAGSGVPIVTDGTVIKYEIPAGISGTGVIRIYTLSGRLVREVDAGNISPSQCYYTTWDGKNRNGQPVANGVYYGILSVGGSKQSSGTFKLAVIK